MGEWLRSGDRDQPERQGDAKMIAIAAGQLERAEDYVVAAIGLEVADGDTQIQLHRIRADLLDARRRLTRPRPVGS